MQFESVWIMLVMWIGLTTLSVWKKEVLIMGGSVLVGFVLGLFVLDQIHALLGWILIMVNVGLLLRVWYVK